MAQATTHIRIRQTTADRLAAEVGRMVAAYERGQQEAVPVTDGTGGRPAGITLDALLNHMLDQREKHRKRGQKRRRRPAAAEGGGQ